MALQIQMSFAEADFLPHRQHVSDVRDYGATGDGTTDDTAAIQAALDSAAGGTVTIPPGTYLTSAPLTISPKTNVQGAGRGAVVIQGTLSLTGADSNVVADLTINPPVDQPGIAITGATRSAFKRINIQANLATAGTSLSIVAAGGAPVYFCGFEDISIIHVRGGGRAVLVEATGGSDWITSCQFKGVTVRGATAEKLAQGIVYAGLGVMEHTHWQDCYVEYVTGEAWLIGIKAAKTVLTNIMTEGAGSAYVVNADNLTAFEVKHFGCTSGWTFGTSFGHNIIGSGLNRLETPLSKTLGVSSADAYQLYVAHPSYKKVSIGSEFAADRVFVVRNVTDGADLITATSDNDVKLRHRRTQATKTADYSMVAADSIIVANGSTLTITLPNATDVAVGRVFTVKNVNASACTVASAASKTIDGAASKSLAQWAAVNVVSDGTNWLTA